MRLASSLPIPEESSETIITNRTFSSNNSDKTLTNRTIPNSINRSSGDGTATNIPRLPIDSLFSSKSDTNSLFKETTGDSTLLGGVFRDDNNEFSRAIRSSLKNQEVGDS